MATESPAQTVSHSKQSQSEQPAEPLLDQLERPTLKPIVQLGRSRFHPRRCATSHLAVAEAPKTFRAAIREAVPDTPGVYAMVDREETIVYVGKSVQLRERVLNYFVDTPTAPQGRTQPRKEHRVGSHARRLLWQPVGHELIALLRELELIQSLSPRFNVRGSADRGRSGYVYVAPGDAPMFRVAPLPPAKAVRSWGPMLLTRSVRLAVERLNHTFGLRDCNTRVHIVYRDQGQLWDEDHAAGCLRAAFGACLAPCAQGCSRTEYAASVRRATAFLDGNDRSVLETMQQQMTAAAAAHQFEKAARLRDTVDLLDLLDTELSLLRDTAETMASFVLPVPDRTGQLHWLLFVNGIAVESLVPPNDEKHASSTLDRLAQPGMRAGESTKVEFECAAVRTVAGWFRQNPETLETAIPLEDAVTLCKQKCP